MTVLVRRPGDLVGDPGDLVGVLRIGRPAAAGSHANCDAHERRQRHGNGVAGGG
jgi:hypothetical protein